MVLPAISNGPFTVCKLASRTVYGELTEATDSEEAPDHEAHRDQEEHVCKKRVDT
jgi:hypothetical protein